MSNLLLFVSVDHKDFDFEIINFSGSHGTISSSTVMTDDLSKSDTYICEIKSNDLSRTTLWCGYLQFTFDTECVIRFDLLVKSSSGETIKWSVLPSFFSIADKGYEPLNLDAVGRLLSDILEFQSVTKAKFFTTNFSGVTQAYACSVEMEDIAETDAILLHFEVSPGELTRTEKILSVTAVELFEQTFVFIGFIEAVEENTAIFTLTGHVYRDQRNSGRRFLKTPINTEAGCLFEVSDFGARIRRQLSDSYEIGETISAIIPNNGVVKFKVVHTYTANSEEQEVGCMVCDDLISRKNWNGFLLTEQYPLLRFRNCLDRSRYKQLLEETGYTTKEFSELNELIRPQVEKEWDYIDETCPANGATVIAEEKNGPMIGTIGVTQVGDSAWTAQVAAMSKNPNYIAYTRALYAWRTRFILQQPNGEYHIAFFQRDKPFLDRFFRKFYLQEKDDSPEDIVWEEWRLYTHILHAPEPSDAVKSVDFDEPLSALFPIIGSKSTHYSAPETNQIKNVQILKGRPFQHLCQYFSSAWADSDFTDEIFQSVLARLGEQQVFTLRTSVEISQLPKSPNGKTIDDGWDVVWVCRRRLLPKFLSNSLRSLELMYKKYGSREVA